MSLPANQHCSHAFNPPLMRGLHQTRKD